MLIFKPSPAHRKISRCLKRKNDNNMSLPSLYSKKQQYSSIIVMDRCSIDGQMN
ncbi:hypothetical protein B4121_3334 [Bacillus paralicheniformis]|uniref:Uncharacterized protein n=1 Tax=Bacillus paralicheniformis TaxID=1648923 RepID=A0A7Z1B2V9_9BACI|nr:hypothetical protein B4121_3334 [Bacillus paralicheniformis]